jgi:hypothetical protein
MLAKEAKHKSSNKNWLSGSRWRYANDKITGLLAQSSSVN